MFPSWLILLGDLYRVVSGKASEQDLVMVKESEEQEQLEELQKELAQTGWRGTQVPPRSWLAIQMTIAVFLLSLLGAMALGMPIAYALIVCGIALMVHMDIFDSQIIAQNIINGADSFPLMAVPFFLLAGEIMNVGGLSKRIVDMCLAFVGHIKGRIRLRSDRVGRDPVGAIRLCSCRCCSTLRIARANDGCSGT